MQCDLNVTLGTLSVDNTLLGLSDSATSARAPLHDAHDPPLNMASLAGGYPSSVTPALPPAGGPPPLPVVHNVIPDQALGIVREATFDHQRLAQAVDLLTSPAARTLKKRHLTSLSKLIAIYSRGFPLDDLVNVLVALNACAELDEPEYIPVMCGLVECLRLPFIMQQASDEVSYRGLVLDSLAQLGYLLRVNHRDLRAQIISSLHELHSGKEKIKALKETKRVSRAYLRATITESGLSETVMKALALVEPSDSELRLKFFQFLRDISLDPANCEQILNAGGAFILCVSLRDYSNSDYKEVELSIEILWNLIEFGNKDLVLTQISNLQCMMPLHGVFVAEMSQGHSLYHRTLRNDLLAIICLIARSNPDGPLIESGIVKSCLLYFTCVETKNKNARVRHLKFSNTPEDFEFKKLLLATILVFADNRSTLSMMEENKLFPALFYYIRPIPTIDSRFDCSQVEEIQLQCIAALCTLTNYFRDLVRSATYVKPMLQFLDWCVSDDGFRSQGNSFYSAGGRSNKYSQLRYCLRFIRQVVKSGDERCYLILVENELILKLLILLNDLLATMQSERTLENPLTQKQDETEAVVLEITCDSLLILSIFSEVNPVHKELIPRDGVELVCQLLAVEPERVCRGLGYHKLLLSVIEAVWCCVVGHSSNERTFLELGGVYSILDTLDSCPGSMRTIFLSCLLDLMENPTAMPHVLTWQNKQGVKAVQLMIRFWKETEAELGIERETSGIIQRITNPLSNPDQSDSLPLTTSEKSPAIAEACDNLRSKVFGFFNKLSADELSGLQPSDYVWLSLIEKYLDFKTAEVWSEINRELQAENIRPTSPDAELLENVIRISLGRAEMAREQQKDLYEAYLAQEKGEEQLFYGEIRETMKQNEKLIRDFDSYIKRTSDYGSLKRAKRNQIESIANSRSQHKPGAAKEHVTMVEGTMTTVFCQQLVTADHVPFRHDDVRKVVHTAASSRREARFSADVL